MSFRNRMQNPNTLMMIGMWSIVLANLAMRFLHPAGLSEDLRDGFIGVLFGVGIATLLLSVRIRARQKGKCV